MNENLTNQTIKLVILDQFCNIYSTITARTAPVTVNPFPDTLLTITMTTGGYHCMLHNIQAYCTLEIFIKGVCLETIVKIIQLLVKPAHISISLNNYCNCSVIGTLVPTLTPALTLHPFKIRALFKNWIKISNLILIFHFMTTCMSWLLAERIPNFAMFWVRASSE